jgi:hypothetical protein
LDSNAILLQILKTIKPESKVSWDKLNSYMKKAGVPQFDYESFKVSYDANPQLQKLVKFDPEGVTINKDAMDQMNVPGNPGRPSDPVGDMAKNATDLSDM